MFRTKPSINKGILLPAVALLALSARLFTSADTFAQDDVGRRVERIAPSGSQPELVGIREHPLSIQEHQDESLNPGLDAPSATDKHRIHSAVWSDFGLVLVLEHLPEHMFTYVVFDASQLDPDAAEYVKRTFALSTNGTREFKNGTILSLGQRQPNGPITIQLWDGNEWLKVENSAIGPKSFVTTKDSDLTTITQNCLPSSCQLDPWGDPFICTLDCVFGVLPSPSPCSSSHCLFAPWGEPFLCTADCVWEFLAPPQEHFCPPCDPGVQAGKCCAAEGPIPVYCADRCECVGGFWLLDGQCPREGPACFCEPPGVENGICCTPNGQIAAECADKCECLGGDWLPYEESCPLETCSCGPEVEPGVCCTPDGQIPADCQARCECDGGSWLPLAVACPISVAFGTCCLPGGGCLQGTDVQCAAEGGIFHAGEFGPFLNSDCEPLCAPPPTGISGP